MNNPNVDRLNSVKTYLLIAWIFSVIIVAIWAISFLFYFVYFFIILGLFGAFGGLLVGFYVATGLVWGIITLVLMIPSILVLRRTGRMRKAANSGDIVTLKEMNSTGWAVVALIFAGVIPGIMLLIAKGPIEELGQAGLSVTSAVYANPGMGPASESLDRIVKLKGLLDSGAISKEEFDQQKNAILHPESVNPTTNAETELKRLKSLFDSGALNKTEYDDQRRRVLNQMM